MNPKIKEYFTQYPNADLILTGIWDQYAKCARFWQFTERDLNIFEPTAIFCRSGYVSEGITKTEFYNLLKKNTVLIINEPIVTIPGGKPPNLCKHKMKAYLEQRKEERKAYRDAYPHFKRMFHAESLRKLLIIGEQEEINPFGREFTNQGWMVNYIYTHQDKWTKWTLKENMILKTLNPDHILIFDMYDGIDVSGIQTPIHYYTKRGLNPNLPLNWTGESGLFFYAYLSAPAMFKKCHRYAMRNVECILIPHCAYPQFAQYNQGNRDIWFGFMGSIDNLPHPYDVERSDYLTVNARSLRNRYIPYAKYNLGLEVFTPEPMDKYVEFLNNTTLVLNIGCIFGLINERQYHAMACGAVLVQNYYKYLDHLGYEDKVNCLLFKDESELKEKIIWAKYHPEEVNRIAFAGMELAMKNTIRERVKEFKKKMVQFELRFK